MRLPLALLLVTACGFGGPRIPGEQGGDAALGDGAPGDGAPGDWWNPAWSARMQIVVDNAAPLAPGYQLGLPRDLDAAPCGGPRDAVRVVRGHTTELPRVIDELDAGDEWIWFRLPAELPATAGPSEYWLYCDNPGAGAAPATPTDVFDLYDSFDGTTLSSTLWRAQGSVSVAGGAVTMPGNNTGIHSAATFDPGTAVDFILQATSSALTNPWFWGGFQTGFTTNAPWLIWHCEDPNLIKQEIRHGGTEISANEQPLDLGPHLYGLEHHGTTADFRYGNAVAGSITYGGSVTQPLNVRLHNFNSTGAIQFHMARVRKAVSPIPTASLGPVERRP